MGETSGGAPYGLSVDEFRRSNEVFERDAPWARAKRALREALTRVSPDVGRLHVDYVESWGRGLSRQAFAAQVDLDPDPSGLSDTYLALIPHADADPAYPARVRREARVLGWVSPRIRNLRVPRPLAVIGNPDAPILVETIVPGLEIDLRKGRMPIQPWYLVAVAAAAVHAVSPPPEDVLPARDRQRHRAEIFHGLFDRLDAETPVVRDARAWMAEHIDRPGPGTLLHGDLLGQNLRLLPGEPLGVIDWENTERGDPAHDLAIVVRGKRRPYQWSDGRELLLAAYNDRAGVAVTADDLRFFELALLVRWYLQKTPVQVEHHHAIVHRLRDA